MTADMFSAVVPRLQLAWDATSLGSLMACPRRYQYEILEGWRSGDNIDLQFGGFFAKACETFRHMRLSGLSHDQATLGAVKQTVLATWGPDGPWSGRYAEQWRCTGAEPYRNAKGNRAKCPWSHAGKWFPGPSPTTCGQCGSGCEVQRRWLTDNPAKDRHALVRLVIWWCDEQPENMEDAFSTVAIGGVPAVELSFTLPLPWTASTGETFLLCGHMDSIGKMGDEYFVADNKTTKKGLTASYWRGYSPNVQVDIYDLAASMLYPTLGVKGVMIEAAQTMAEGARFGSMPFYRNDVQRDELLVDLEYWTTMAEQFAETKYWPMNRKSCLMCPFQPICSRPPEKREMYLESLFTKSFWNPLEAR